MTGDVVATLQVSPEQKVIHMLTKRLVALALVMSSSLAIVQCASPEASTKADVGSLEGLVRLVLHDGDIKKGAGNTVYLVGYTDPLVQNARAICDRIASDEIAVWTNARRALQQAQGINAKAKVGASSGAWERAIALSDSAFNTLKSAVEAQTALESDKDERAAREIRELLTASGSPRVTRTGDDARYRFDDVTGGKYLLFAEWQIGEMTHHWLIPVDVGVSPVVQDLDTEAKSRHVCPSQH